VKEHFKRQITVQQSRDTGMALVLVLLIAYLYRKREGYIFVAIALHVVNMTVPAIYRPAAVVWLGLSEIIGAVMSKVILAVIFFVVVTPVGLVRGLLGKDSLRLRAFKASNESVMVNRNHKFVGADLERPY
jgi:hypothetical protein